MSTQKQLEEMTLTTDIGDTIEFMNDVFDDAIKSNASDLHFEPEKEFLLIRFRQDGDFRLVYKIDNENLSTIITKLKVQAKVQIDISNKPQDGQINYMSNKLHEEVDMRVSTLPTVYGEKVVIRLLRQDESLINLDSLGFLDHTLAGMKEVLKQTFGIILVAGPTGSGKSTTLFGVLKHFDPLNYNISTLEDPVEYNMEYVNQSNVRSEIGYTFASGLRSLVRQDPDIIMVGEIRDKETATLAIEAALTGHLVLSTIHTNSAAATVQRLINMGIEPFLISSALKMVVSQRLAKRICSECKEVDELGEEKLKKVYEYLSDILDEEEIEEMTFYKGAGCEKCNNSGYKGRAGVHEVLVLGPYLEDSILAKAPASEIHEKGTDEGMLTIIQDALIKASQGATTVDEALKLLG